MNSRLDDLTRSLTAFSSFDEMVNAHESYWPSIYPPRNATQEEIDDYLSLADAYDARQAERHDPRRAYRGSTDWWKTAAILYPNVYGYIAKRLARLLRGEWWSDWQQQILNEAWKYKNAAECAMHQEWIRRRGLTLAQATWAEEHDWFEGVSQLKNGLWAVTVLEISIGIDPHLPTYGSEERNVRTFTDFRKLRDWAGY